MSEAADLLAQLTASGRPVSTLRATVSAYREDGMVNVTYGSAAIYGIPCLASYTNRKIGDVVQLLNLGNSTWLVLGKLGGADTSYTAPLTQNSSYGMYDTTTLAPRNPLDAGYEGLVGAGSAKDSPVLLAWSYYNGSTNSLTTAAAVAGKTGMVVTVARTGKLHGQRKAVEMQLCPHNYNALPTTTITLNTASFSPVVFRLEVGEVRNITLPADWWTALKAATPTIKGFAVRPLTTTPWQSGYAIFNTISGGFRTI